MSQKILYHSGLQNPILSLLRQDQCACPSICWFLGEEIILNDFKTSLSSRLLPRLLKCICIGSIIECSVPSPALIYFGTLPNSDTVSKYNFAVTFGYLLYAPTCNQSIFPEKPSTSPWILKPQYFDLSYPLMCHVKLGPGLLYLRLYKRLPFLRITPPRSSSLIRSLKCFLTNKPLRTSIRYTLRYPTLETLSFSSSCTACRISSLEERTAARGLLFKLLSFNHLFRVDKLI